MRIETLLQWIPRLIAVSQANRLHIPLTFLFTTFFSVSAAAQSLQVVSAGPVGEVASLAEANEVRVTFSEPMVTLGRIPERVTAPFFRINPVVAGSSRWAGTRTLIFSADEKKPLPFATKFTVTIDASATSAAGNRLGKPYTFSFTTPTVRLLNVESYTKTDGVVVMVLRFNQPVTPSAIASHLTAAFKPHPFTPPSPPAQDRVTPESFARFQEKVKGAAAAAAAKGPVPIGLAPDWNKKQFPPSPEMVVFETKSPVAPESWIELVVGPRTPSMQGKETPGKAQRFTVQANPAFFVDKIQCTAACDPDSNNPIELRMDVLPSQIRQFVRVMDITNPQQQVEVRPSAKSARAGEGFEYTTRYVSLDELGFSLQPAHTYSVTIGEALTATDGQKLGYTWAATIENWHRTAFSSFGEGHGVWETGGGKLLPFYARNLQNVRQWILRLDREQLMPTILRLSEQGFAQAPGTPFVDRKLAPVPDKTQSYGVDLTPALGTKQTGLVWAAVKEGEPIPRSRFADESARTRATIVQVTNLGITVKDSPLNTLIFVTRLDTGSPVEGARVAIRTRDNKELWSGTTDRNGLALAPNTPMRLGRRPDAPAEEQREEPPPPDADEDEIPMDWGNTWELRFIVTAEKDGDIAYVASDWTQGIMPWEFEMPFSLAEAKPFIRGSVFADRGVYKLGEEVHLKAILRSDTPEGVRLFAAGTPITISIRDSFGNRVDRRTINLSEWSSADWVFKVAPEGRLGSYEIRARAEGHYGLITGDFLVAAYRRPDFRVDVNLSGDPLIAGNNLRGTVTARYLFGGAMAGRPVRWTYTRQASYDVPAAVTRRFSSDRYQFVGYDYESEDEEERQRVTIASKEETLDANGSLQLDLATELKAGVPQNYSLEAEVEDVSRQRIANRASVVVHPAPWYVGVKRPSYFLDQSAGLTTEIVVVGLDGNPVTGIPVNVTLKRIQWNSVRRAEGGGFYTWETERKILDAGSWTVESKETPVPLSISFDSGGSYQLVASAKDDAGRSTRTIAHFYVLGEGYTAWRRFDHNRIELVPERSRYRPGETARIMIQSPWETATALMTTEREGIRFSRQFQLDSTHQTIDVPITENDIPNLFVSVVLIKGRTSQQLDEAGEDPGKPAFRVGYAQLEVEDVSKKLSVEVKANKEEFRPAAKTKVDVLVKDDRGSPVQAEVTLWAVDVGVLSLTDYRLPDVLHSVWVAKSLQVLTEDSRQKIISRRVLTPKGVTDGGGGGRDPGTAALRKDFRVLAFWVGSLITDAKGRASTEVKLPESLTTYRIFAVAADRQSRFGQDDTEIRINKPVLLRAAFPRFLSVGDESLFGSVVHNQLREGGSAIVTIRSLDPTVLEFTGETKKNVELSPGGSAEVRFNAKAKAVGDARVQMTVRLRGESDAFEDVIPVRLIATPEVVAAYGETQDKATETLETPSNVVPGFGGLHLELASTALVGLGEGARYLVEYPYGCAEQRSSRGLALMLASELGGAFRLPGIDATKTRAAAQANLLELEKFQCENGGFAFWPGSCESATPYMTSYVLHVLQRGQKLGYPVKPEVLNRGYDYLTTALDAPPPENEGWWPSYTAWQAFAVKVLAEGDRNADSATNRLFDYLDRMPIFALSHLYDALIARRMHNGRIDELERRIRNAIAPEAGTAHVEELSDPHLLWFWNSNVRSTAIVLGSLVRNTNDPALNTQMVRWLMSVRKDGRWGNTQENAWAMGSLVDYFRKYEREKPDFVATATAGTTRIAREEFRGRSTDARVTDVPMAKLPTGRVPLNLEKEGTGTLFFMARLKYALGDLMVQSLDRGFHIERIYSPLSNVATKTYRAGDLVRVTLRIEVPKERRYVAVTDPLPGGFEAVESWFATTASDLAQEQQQTEERGGAASWVEMWQRGGFDHVERHDDRVNLFATRLSEGRHQFSYVVRATTAGTFRTSPTHAEEMYEPEVFGRGGTDVVEVKP